MSKPPADPLKQHLYSMEQADTYAALRQLGFTGLHHSDPNVRAVSAMLIRVTSELRPEDFLHEISLIRTGGYSSPARAVAIRRRDIMLQRLYRQMLPRPKVREAARWIIKKHSQWVRSMARKDAERGFCLGDEFEVIFFEISRLGVQMPESDDQIARIISRLAKHPEGPLDAAPIEGETSA